MLFLSSDMQIRPTRNHGALRPRFNPSPPRALPTNSSSALGQACVKLVIEVLNDDTAKLEPTPRQVSMMQSVTKPILTPTEETAILTLSPKP